MQLHKKIFIVALVLSICISLYFLINEYNILNFPILTGYMLRVYQELF